MITYNSVGSQLSDFSTTTVIIFLSFPNSFEDVGVFWVSVLCEKYWL